MTTFIIAAAIITILALGILVLPLLRTRNTVSYERQAQNIHYAKERLEELEAQLKNASISATDYEALKLEIESTLAHDIDIANNSTDEQTDGPRRSNKLVIGLLSVFLPLSALGFYWVVGTPKALTLSAQVQPESGEIESLISGVEERLAENPDDLDGWQLLSKTYLTLGRYSDAQRGYKRVLELGGESDRVYASLADATALASGGEITDEASSYVERALTINPNNRQALWLAGLGGAQGGNQVIAKQYWNRLIPLLDDAPQQQQELRAIIRENFGDQAADKVASQSSSSQSSESSTQTGLTVKVSLAPEVANLASDNDFVFIFAKAEQGPPAPLAVKRLRVADLPTSITLTDADAMIPAMALSKFENVVVSARVSKSGQPIAQAGDLQSTTVPTKNTATEAIELTILSIVK